MYSGIHVFSLANILKTGRESMNGVKDFIYKNRRKNSFFVPSQALFRDFQVDFESNVSVSYTKSHRIIVAITDISDNVYLWWGLVNLFCTGGSQW